MKLIYFQKVPNFGDALNPLIFDRFFPGFFDEKEDEVFLGIGSILHLKFPPETRKIVFSTGYAYYGDLPVIDKTYNISCVRGPLTAKALGLDSKLGITDGAALLRKMYFPNETKIFDYSFMPHHASLHFNDWEKICNEIGYNYIDPADDIQKVLQQISQSKVVIAEAMHGAIVADTLRVPWIPVKLYPTINEFKWKDWTESLALEYIPNTLPSIYSSQMVNQKIAAKFRAKERDLYVRGISKVYETYQDNFLNRSLIKQFAALKSKQQFLSNEKLLDQKIEQLLDKIEMIKSTYGFLQKSK
ncbi:polysaccharide pyruvyl transferase family protein [Salegentibacter sp. Hel_I_6]|uniref:polysaccharide pyruvyl transferase family protein n=1 Tax=Salegentibacter sp. Hel_I_6 TaxID=1250278 RepID=UPI00068C6E96|nr:polysaccharide pyruvyl transferase family protein [Salegentibacter sp. Hel_I_6]